MQGELEIPNALHAIEFDIIDDTRLLASITCGLDDSFEDLHFLICQKVHLHPRALYRFFVPRIHTAFRYLPRSKDLFSSKKLISIITVGDDVYYQNNAHQIRLKVRGIGIEIDNINIERELRRAMVALKDTVAKTTYTKKNHIQRENLTLLYQLGSSLIEQQFQKLLPDQTTILFNLKGNNLLAYCLVSVTHEQVEYFFFPDQLSFQRYMLVKKDAYLSSMHKEKYKDGIAFVLSKKRLKETDMSSPFNSQIYVEHACYMYFYDVQRGFEVDVVSSKQAKDLMRYFVALQKAISKIKTFPSEFTNINTSLYIGYNPHTKTTILQSGPKLSTPIDDIPYNNSEIIIRIQEFNRSIEVVELDFFLCVKNKLSYPDERARYMLEGVCMGRDYRKVISDAYQREEQIQEVLLDLLLGICEESGIPQKVLVRERCVFAQIHDFCKQLGIQVEIYARLPKIDAFHQARLQKKGQ